MKDVNDLLRDIRGLSESVSNLLHKVNVLDSYAGMMVDSYRYKVSKINGEKEEG